MISIIICSRTADISQELKDNIASTIGCEYELCVIDNSHNDYSIFSAYNEGVRRAKGEILCFLHDDVSFHTNEWGMVLSNILDNPKVGVVGVAGGHFLPSVPMYWPATPYVSEYVINNDHGKCSNPYRCEYHDSNGISEVVICDGLYLAFKSSIFEQVHFDEEYYDGFHMYDMDICMQIQQIGLQCVVTNKILLEHAWSEEDMKQKKGMDKFDHNLHLFVAKWQEMLPIWRGGPDLPEYTRQRIANLCFQAYDARLARQSYAYRLGRALLTPFNFIKKIFKAI